MWYALQVRNGFELEIADRLNQYAAVKNLHSLIKGIFAGVKKVVKMTPKGRKLNIDSVLTGYIFVKLDELTAELWHFFKGLPGVYKVLDSSPISSEEIEKLHSLCKGEVEVKIDENSEINKAAEEVCEGTPSIEEEPTVTEPVCTDSQTEVECTSGNKNNTSLLTHCYEVIRKGAHSMLRVPIDVYRRAMEYDDGLKDSRNERDLKFILQALKNYATDVLLVKKRYDKKSIKQQNFYSS